MSDLDVIELPGQPGKYARRVIVDAWIAAGSPPVNSALRLVPEQQKAFDLGKAGKGSPADNPAETWRPLAHVRGVGLDITPTPDRVRRLTAAGLVRPYSYELWHWQLPGDVRRFALVTSLPTPTPAPTGTGTPMTLEEFMSVADKPRLFLTLHKGSLYFCERLVAMVHVLPVDLDVWNGGTSPGGAGYWNLDDGKPLLALEKDEDLPTFNTRDNEEAFESVKRFCNAA